MTNTKIELLELLNKTYKIFDVSNTKDLNIKLKETVLNNNIEIYSKFQDLVQDLSVDWLQKIFQYYEADRKEKKQDYTPKCLARLVSELTNSDDAVCVDMCAGSGALTIQKWNMNKETKFICLEFDKNVIPYLLFNLAVRNITATVYNCDVLTCEVFAKYDIKSGEKYSTVKLLEDTTFNVKGNICVSNPPYNMKWELPVFAQLQPRFSNYELPPESNANYAFILSALDYADKIAMIMPNGILSTDNKNEATIRKQLIDYNFIETIILCPDSMFEATNIGTCIVVFNKNKKNVNIEMIDMRNNHDSEIREQNGQFGGKSHTNRTYKKSVNIFSEDNIQYILSCISEQKNESESCISANIEMIKQNNYILTPSRYIEFQEKQIPHRTYAEIITDLNRCVAMKNACKLTINETIANQIGFDIDSFKADNTTLENDDFIEKISGIKPIKHDYITFSKNKNEVKFENKSKDFISPIFMMIFQQWKQMIYTFNIEENRYLIELRDAILPELMSGKLTPEGEMA